MVAGHAEVQLGHGLVRFSACRAEAPLVLRPLGARPSALLYVGQLGGGYVAGDEYAMHVDVRAGATLHVLGQASAKVYGGARTVHVVTTARVESGGCVALLGEPLVPYADSSFVGTTRVELADGASALIWDSFTAGRLARGERWQQRDFDNALELVLAGGLVVRDAVRLRGDVAEACGPANGFATLVAAGPRFAGAWVELEQRVRRLPLASFSRRGEAAVVRIGVTEPGSLLALRARIAEWLLHS